jgi:hypothetical protein
MQFRSFAATILFATSAIGSDSPGGTPGEKSANLQKDIQEMWSVSKGDNGFTASTNEAISAANRVFNTVDLKGLSKGEISKLLRVDLRSPKYGYIAPFWPVKENTFVLRFDCGLYGWQFDIYLDKKERCKKVERKWIH